MMGIGIPQTMHLTERDARNRCPSPKAVLRAVRRGRCNEIPSSQHQTGGELKTYRGILEGLVKSSRVSQENANRALFEGEPARRARVVLGAVSIGKYYYPNESGPVGAATYGEELLVLVSMHGVKRAAAEKAVREGNEVRAGHVLKQIKYGRHEELGGTGEAYAQELMKLVDLGAVSAKQASRAMRSGYRLRATSALANAEAGLFDESMPNGLAYREELYYLMHLGYVSQDAAHKALWAGHLELLRWHSPGKQDGK
jgi:hypothetical protein